MYNPNPYSTVWKTIAEAAAYLGITEIRLKQLQQMKQISFFKMRGKLWCTEHNLNKYQKDLQGK
jgi:hypothetical protein